MSLRDDVLRRILSLDARRSAELALQTAEAKAQARSGAVVALAGDGYRLFASTDPDDSDLLRIASAWNEHRVTLLNGAPVVIADWAVMPIGRPVVGLVYLCKGKLELTPVLLRNLINELGDLFLFAFEARDRAPESRAMHELYLARTPMKDIERDKLQLMMRLYEGKKSRVAKALGTTRPTLYKWLAKHGLDGPK